MKHKTYFTQSQIKKIPTVQNEKISIKNRRRLKDIADNLRVGAESARNVLGWRGFEH